jgi:amidase
MISRRLFLRLGAAAVAAPALPEIPRAMRSGGSTQSIRSFPLEEATIEQLQRALAAGELTSRRLAELYSERIEELDRQGPALRSVLELNPEVRGLADGLDEERKRRGPRGPLHGIPVLLKDNIDTADRMATTAGSIALEGSIPLRDATVAEKLRKAGAILLGKTNMSEWANFRSSQSCSGWSSRGDQCLNPYALDRSPCGSSSGSAVAVASNLAPVALGTETDGSIVCPAAACALVGIKPTVGLVSRSGVIPIAHSQDTVGPLGRSVADAAILLGLITGRDSRDRATAAGPGGQVDYTRFLDPDGLRGSRIGVPREVYFGYSEETDRIMEEALEVMRELGATVVDPANIPTAERMASDPGELEVLEYEFKADLDRYLAGRGPRARVRSLAGLIEFNTRNAARVMAYFGQDLLVSSQARGPLTDRAYRQALSRNRRLSRREGIDAVLAKRKLDALVAPTGSPAFKIDLLNGDHFLGASSSPAALAGYPLVTVPAGDVWGLPVGISFMGTAFSEPTLVKLAYAFEQATHFRKPPQFLPTVDPGRRASNGT